LQLLRSRHGNNANRTVTLPFYQRLCIAELNQVHLALGDFMMGLTSRLLASGILLFSFASSASAVDQSKQSRPKAGVPKQVWVIVTHPMMSCGAPDDDVSIRQTLLDVLARSPAEGKLPEGCSMLKVGTTFMLDHEQSEAETKIAVKLWAPVCPQGCVPSMTLTPVYAPPRRLVGIYLRPTKPPKGW
jgi:hypothetical protein